MSNVYGIHSCSLLCEFRPPVSSGCNEAWSSSLQFPSGLEMLVVFGVWRNDGRKGDLGCK